MFVAGVQNDRYFSYERQMHMLSAYCVDGIASWVTVLAKTKHPGYETYPARDLFLEQGHRWRGRVELGFSKSHGEKFSKLAEYTIYSCFGLCASMVLGGLGGSSEDAHFRWKYIVYYSSPRRLREVLQQFIATNS